MSAQDSTFRRKDADMQYHMDRVHLGICNDISSSRGNSGCVAMHLRGLEEPRLLFRQSAQRLILQIVGDIDISCLGGIKSVYHKSCCC